jgi:hypothetical protein
MSKPNYYEVKKCSAQRTKYKQCENSEKHSNGEVKEYKHRIPSATITIRKINE